MGLSETILAAMIGALATVTTALFQLFTAFKARGKVDAKPKRGTTLRSILAVLALMVASAAGGFLYSEFIKQRNAEDMRAMRQEMRELKELTAARMHELEAARDGLHDGAEHTAADAVELQPAASSTTGGSAESMVYVPACRRASAMGEAAACTEADAQRIALCGAIPAYARTRDIALFAQPNAVQHPWQHFAVALEQDIGGARFTGRTFEYAQGGESKAVCTNFMQWSGEHPYIARMVVHYGFGEMSEPLVQPEPTPFDASAPFDAPATMALDPPTISPQTASFVR